MTYRYDTRHLSGQQRAIINQMDERNKNLKKSNEEVIKSSILDNKIIFHESDFEELRKMIEREQKIKLSLKEKHKNNFSINEENLSNKLDTAEGTVDIAFRFEEKRLIVSNFFLRITGISTGSHIIEWFIAFCKKNNLVDFMVRIVNKDKVAMNEICKKFGFKKIANDEECDDYLLEII